MECDLLACINTLVRLECFFERNHPIFKPPPAFGFPGVRSKTNTAALGVLRSKVTKGQMPKGAGQQCYVGKE